MGVTNLEQTNIALYTSGGHICPPLPAGVQFDLELGKDAGQSIDRYLEQALAISPATPSIFHESAALTQVGIVVARRLKIQMPHAAVFPNLCSAWVAPTTLYAKTTGLEIPRRNLRSRFPHLLGAQEMTLEAMLADMAGLEPVNLATLSEEDQDLWKEERNFAAQRGLIIDEMSGLFAGAGKDYNAGLIEAILRLSDCDEHFVRSTRGQGRLSIRNAYLVFLGASTPGGLAPHLNSERLWSMGVWPRFALLTPEDGRPAWQEARPFGGTLDLSATLCELYTRLPPVVWPQTPIALDVGVGTTVLNTWTRYDKSLRYDLLTPELPERLWGWYGRAPTQVLKVAVLLAALDWKAGAAPKIELPHLMRAISIVESWRASVHRLLAMTTQSVYSTMQQRITRLLALADPHGATLRDMYKAFRDKTPFEIESVLEQMARVNEIIVVDVRPGPQGGRPTKRYRLAAV